MNPLTDKRLRQPAEIIENRFLSGRNFRLVCRCRGELGSIGPGQFFMVQVAEGIEPFLPRPFSVSDVIESRDGTEVVFTYHVAGKGTDLLSQRKAGEQISVLGPLGRGFDLGPFGPEHLMVAGGIGAAPFPCLARKLAARDERMTYMVGARSASDLLFVDEMAKLDAEVSVSTDDGSRGIKGTVLEILVPFLDKHRPTGQLNIYVCGPDVMLRAVAAMCRQRGFDAQLSLEARMACGVGACQGCAVEVKSDTPGRCYKRVCVEGPVFKVNELL